eukprot:487231-Ditylum_brightwellii.AAC.1
MHLLASSAIVLVTHASQFLNRVDNIMVLVEGRPSFLGTWDDLKSFECKDELTMRSIESLRTAVQETSET